MKNKILMIGLLSIIFILSSSFINSIDYSESYYTGENFYVPYNALGPYVKGFYGDNKFILAGISDIRIYTINDLSYMNLTLSNTYSNLNSVTKLHYLSRDGLSAYFTNISGLTATIMHYNLVAPFNFSDYSDNDFNFSVYNPEFRDIVLNDDESKILILYENSTIREYDIVDNDTIVNEFDTITGGGETGIALYQDRDLFIGSSRDSAVNYLDIFEFNSQNDFQLSNLLTSKFFDVENLTGDDVTGSNSLHDIIPINDEYFVYFGTYTPTPNKKLYLFSTNTTGQAPEKYTDYLSLNMDYNKIYEINLNDYATNYRGVSLTMYDNITNTTIFLNQTKYNTSNETYDASTLNVELIPNSSHIDLFVNSKSIELDFTGNLTFYNEYGTKTIILYIVVDEYTGVSNIAIIPPVNIGFNSQNSFLLNSYISNYDNVSLKYYDNCSGIPASVSYLFASKTGVSTTASLSCVEYKLIPSSNNIEFVINSKTTNVSSPLKFFASNQYGASYSNSFLLTISSEYVNGTTITTEVVNEGNPTINSWLDAISSIFPDGDTLNNGSKTLFVIIVMLLTIALLVALTIKFGDGARIITFIGISIILLEIFYFTFIGYIPVIYLIMLGLFGGIIVYYFVNKSINGGG